jgi:hypothetical protein
MRQSMRLMIEEASEAEVTESLARGYCDHGAEGGYRNGYRLGRLRSAEGVVQYGSALP